MLRLLYFDGMLYAMFIGAVIGLAIGVSVLLLSDDSTDQL